MTKRKDDPNLVPTLPEQTLAERRRASRRPLPKTLSRDFGPYHIEASLGRGGMGEVFKAWDSRLRRHVALKLILDDEPFRVARFRREAQAQARVEHPHVCQVYEVGELDGQYYIAMQYIDGEQLGKALEPATLEQKVTVMKNVAEALHAAHRQGLVHRDVKPSNIMVETACGDVFKAYVLDFGLALEQTSQITTTFELMGTPQFMAPEQLDEEARLDRRTDVYALGATFYTVLARRPPFEGSLGEVMRKVVEVDPAPLRTVDPSLPLDIETIVAKCLEKQPNHRYDSARALADELDRYLNGEPIEARPQTLTYRLVKKARKHRRLVTVAVTLLMALVTSLAWGWHSRRTASQKTRLAQRFGQKVEKIEAQARLSEMLPLHDTTADQERIRTLMGEIEDEMHVLGSVSEASGHYALGRGHLVLRDGEKALFHLRTAWDLGYQDPEAALALGRTLGFLYQRGSEELRRIPEEEDRARRRAELDTDLRHPALELLQQGSDAALDSPDLIRAQLAYYADQLPEALAAVRATVEKAPWIYEARVLEGHVYAWMAHDKDRRGEYEDARADYDRALEAYETALEVGRSHVAALESVCEVRLEMVQLALKGNEEGLEELFDACDEACHRALVAEPRSSDALLTLADFHRLASGQRDDPARSRADLERALEMIDRLLEIQPTRAETHGARASLSFELAEHAPADRAAELRQTAEASLRRAIELNSLLQREYASLIERLGW